MSCEFTQTLCSSKMDIQISGGRIEPCMSRHDYLYPAATRTGNSAVPLDEGWISYNSTLGTQPLQNDLTVNIWVEIMLPEEGVFFAIAQLVCGSYKSSPHKSYGCSEWASCPGIGIFTEFPHELWHNGQWSCSGAMAQCLVELWHDNHRVAVVYGDMV